jgi:hypothetical protein
VDAHLQIFFIFSIFEEEEMGADAIVGTAVPIWD